MKLSWTRGANLKSLLTLTINMNKQIILSLLIITLLGCSKTSDVRLSHELISIETDALFDEMVDIRRELHQYPELAGDELKTKKFIEKYLVDLGVELLPNVYGHGVIGVIRGAAKGRTIAWRADMDALPNDLPDEVDFKSKIVGVQHGCGHDVHMAIGLGIAKIFSQFKESIKGTVYIIFQPEEETFIGAQEMVEDGIVAEFDFDEIFALHVTALPVGTLMVKPKEMYAYQKRIEIRFNQKLPEASVKELYNQIKSGMTRVIGENQPWQILAAFDINNGLNHPKTIFKDYLIMDEQPMISTEGEEMYIRANLYETDQDKVPSILPQIKQIIEGSTYKESLSDVSYIQENPTVYNDEELTIKASQTLEKVFGSSLVLPSYGQIPYFNDDFCYFQQAIPGVYFLLGGSNDEKGLMAMNHAPNFRVDEECIKIGIRAFTSLIFERLQVNE